MGQEKGHEAKRIEVQKNLSIQPRPCRPLLWLSRCKLVERKVTNEAKKIEMS